MAPVPTPSPSSLWTAVHTVQAVLGGAAVTAGVLAVKLTGTWATDAGVVAVVLTAVLSGLSFYSNAVFGSAAQELKTLRAMAKRQ